MDKIKILDGGTGVEIRRRGYEVPYFTESIWSAQSLIDNPEIVEQIHYDYINAGAEYITINNYSLTQPILSRAKIENRLTELTCLSIDLAINAKTRSKKDVKIIGSLPPLETSYRSDLVINKSDMLDNYRVIAAILENKVDVILCETMSSSIEAKTAVQAALETNSETWVSWTLQGSRSNTLPSGESIEQAFNELENVEPDAYLLNCCGANFVTDGIKILKNLTDKPIGGYANSSLVESINNTTLVDSDPRISQQNNSTPLNEWEYANETYKWIENGANIIGGCCGTSPNHIKELNKIVERF
jgi:S-methylmethionine-dependent homocysteine/selenocysteine methylase